MKFQALALALLGLVWPGASTFGQSAGQTFALDVKPADSRAVGQLTAILTSAGNEVLRQEMTLPWSGRWPFDPAASESILSFESAALWAGPLTLDGTDRQVEVLPRAELVFQVEKGDKPDPQPPTITVEVTSAPPALPTTLPATRPKEGFKLKKTRLACALAGERWRCPAPALALDLRLDLLGHVPHYVWNAQLEPGKTLDLGKLRFQKGASISGWVTVAEGELKGVTVGLAPAVAPQVHEAQRAELSRREAPSNDRGFFQIQGVEVGNYRLMATRKGLAKIEIYPIEVRAGSETTLSDPVHLDLPLKFELKITPPLGPGGAPWKIGLHKLRPGSNTTDREIYGSADQTGAWSQEGLDAGAYFLHVMSADGEETGTGSDSVWHEQDLEVAPGLAPLFINIEAVEVIGTIFAGDEPVQGRLIFGGFHGVPKAVIRSDEDGKFSGLLPRAGEWALDVEVDERLLPLEPVVVEKRRGRPAELEVRLPDTHFHGRVVHHGKPVADIPVSGYAIDAPMPGRFDAVTDAEGKFEVRGPAPGRYRVKANSGRHRLGSMPRDFEISPGNESQPVEIEVEEFLTMDGKVFASGQPARSALYIAYLSGRNGQDSRFGRTDSTGTFHLGFQESTRQIAMVVDVPGFSWRIARIRTSSSVPGAMPTVIEVPPNGGTISFEVGALAGSLTFEGVEVPLLGTSQVLQGWGAARVVGDRMVLRNAAPGFYRVCFAGQCREGQLAPGGRLDFDLERSCD